MRPASTLIAAAMLLSFASLVGSAQESATTATQVEEGQDPDPRSKHRHTFFMGSPAHSQGGACKAAAHALADALCGQRRGGSSREAKRGRFTGNRLNAPLERYARPHRSPGELKQQCPSEMLSHPCITHGQNVPSIDALAALECAIWGVPCGDSLRGLCSLQPALRLSRQRAGPRTRPGRALNIPRWHT